MTSTLECPHCKRYPYLHCDVRGTYHYECNDMYGGTYNTIEEAAQSWNKMINRANVKNDTQDAPTEK